MATLKQLQDCYVQVKRAEKNLRNVLSKAEKMGLMEKPSDDVYQNSVWKPLNEIGDKITSRSQIPLGKAMQAELRKKVYGY